MLHEFVSTRRDRLIALCMEKVGRRASPSAGRPCVADQERGVQLFLDQLNETLRMDAGSCQLESLRVSGRSGGEWPDISEIGNSAAEQGREMQRRGFTFEQVVHHYGDVCQAITELAIKESARVSADEFHTLNRCLDNALARAVTEYGHHHDLALLQGKQVANAAERLGHFAHEQRNLLQTATLAITAIKAGKAGFAGATAAVFDRSMQGLRHVIDAMLAEVRLSGSVAINREVIPVAEFVAEIKTVAEMMAQAKGCRFTVAPVEQGLALEGDRQLLASAVTNLLQNAFKFTAPQGNVSLKVCASGEHLLMEVADECGGLPEGKVEQLFHPFMQRADDRTGLGLGLSIACRAVKANGGKIQVRNLPGTGCVFTIDLPLHEAARLPEGPGRTGSAVD